jgi:DNA-directed RNA polymerase specialized sigma24 family protein
MSSFDEFVVSAAPRLRSALVALLGVQVGQEATLDSLSYAWENWERVSVMDNPVGFLYVVGRNSTRKARKGRVILPVPPEDRTPWVEPGLAGSLAGLPDRQRQAVMLVHGYGWTLSEVAEMLGVSKATVQKHADRGVRKLRDSLGVEL